MASPQYLTQPPGTYYQIHDTAAEKAAQYYYQGQSPQPQNFPTPPQPQFPAGHIDEDDSVSIGRNLVRGFLIVFVLLLVTIIGLSAGLGVSQRNLHQTESNLQIAQQAVSAAALGPDATTITVTATPVSPTTTSKPTPTSVKSDVQCPSINGTTLTTSTTSNSTSTEPNTNTTTTKKFLLLCGLDYGEGEATDIGNTKVKNLNACAEACAKKANCTGAGWGVIKGDKGPEHTCWMKTGLIRSHNATGTWGFAMLLGKGEGE
ncbi:hypothetical protein QBC34DRAFT_467815 [Podospora aff. communis PSN243]|uniref:Apple domain-containing protein n=1 Tax=Podospora aff. communis PSN243 TaxID=3040156 RepID=A0AAV9GGE9_9PEZI|nr:hypothetical protein QBC34DRAFT_467815 [Podospora aff. communis PSN243]